jgi:hypothetical protein
VNLYEVTVVCAWAVRVSVDVSVLFCSVSNGRMVDENYF